MLAVFNFSLGTGGNYVHYAEKLTTVTASYDNTATPSSHFAAGVLGERFGFEVSHNSAPITFDNAKVGLNNVDANWTTDSFFGIYAIKKDNESREHPAGSQGIKLYFGEQLHQFPLPLFDSTTSAPLLRTMKMTTLSVGLSWAKKFKKTYLASIQMNYQNPISTQPLQSGSTLSISAPEVFDGSIGIDKSLSKRSAVGLHWYGQSHKFNFEYTDPNVSDSGAHEALFSNVEFRFTFSF